MNVFKLGQKGIAHYVIPLLIIVVVGIGGTAAYLSTHADPTSACTNIPSSPSNLSASTEGVWETNLNWSPSSAVSPCKITYSVYRDGSLDATVKAPVHTYIDGMLTADKSYNYYVVASDQAGPASLSTATVKASTDATANSDCVVRTFSLASTPSVCVKYAQYMINSLNSYFTQYNNADNGQYPPITLTVDEHYGPETENQVFRWQWISNLPQNTGNLGVDTWNKLCYFNKTMYNGSLQTYGTPSNLPAFITTSNTYANAASC